MLLGFPAQATLPQFHGFRLGNVARTFHGGSSLAGDGHHEQKESSHRGHYTQEVSRVPWKHLVALPILLLLYVYGVDKVGLLSTDEPRYAAIGRAMAESGDWVTPRLWGEPWFEKPALLYWFIALGYKASLGDDLAPRLPVGLLAIAFLFFFFHQLRREFGKEPAYYATVLLTTCVGFLAYGQVAVPDSVLAVTFSCSMLICLPWVRSGGRRGLAAGGVMLGFAVLAKGLVPLVLAAPIVWAGRRRWKDLAFFVVPAAVVAAPWYVLCWARNGSVFLDEFLWRHHFGRFVSPDLQHVQPWWFYFPVLAGLLFPWTPLLLLLRPARENDPRHTLLWAWFLFGFVFFSVSRNKLPGYILPILPPVCTLIGLQLARVVRAAWLLPVCSLLVPLLPWAGTILPEAVLTGFGRTPVPALPLSTVCFGIALAGLSTWAIKAHRRELALTTAATGVLGSVIFLKTAIYGRLDAAASARPLWQSVASSRSELCVQDLHRAWRYGLNFYAHGVVVDCATERKPVRIVGGEGRLPLVVKSHERL